MSVLVLSGGGPFFFNMLGALHKTNLENKWSLDTITKIRGSSAGGVLSVILSLKYDWQIIIDYFVNRPWEKVFDINLTSIMASYETMGLYGTDKVIDMLAPLFVGKNLDLSTITLLEFFNWSKVHIELYTTELIEFKLFAFSHINTPDIPLVNAIQATMAIPFLFRPIIINEKIYTDGGLICNFPNISDDINENTIGFVIKHLKNSELPTNAQEYISMIINKLVNSNELQHLPNTTTIYQVYVEKPMTEMNATTIYNLLCNKEERGILYKQGFDYKYL